MRYIINDAPAWSEELARYLNAVITFLGSAMAIRIGAHVSLDFLTSILGEKAKRTISFFNEIICLVFFVLLMLSSITYIKDAGDQLATGLRIPMGIPYSIIVISSILGILYCIPPVFGPVRATSWADSHLLDRAIFWAA